MTRPPVPPLYKSYRATFHIFPAMIPLIELLPWLLGLIGGAAGLTEFLREKIWRKPRMRWVLGLSCFSLLLALTVLVVHQSRLVAPNTSVAVTPDKFSVVTTYDIDAGKPVPPASATFGLIWRQSTPAMLMGNPALTDTLLLVGAYDGTLEARRRSDGQKLWSLQKKEPVFTSAFIADGIGVIGEGLHTAPSATITGFAPETGNPLWERTFRSHVETAPAYDAASGLIFQGTGSEGLWALSLETGAVEWHSSLGHIDVAPLYQEGALYVPAKLSEDSDGSAVFRLDADDGAVVWKTDIPGNPMGNVLDAGDGQIILATAVGQVGRNLMTDKGWVHSLDQKGKLLWSAELRAMPLPEGNSALAHNLAYFALKNGELVALDTRTGKEVWAAQYGGEIQSDAALYEVAGTLLIAAVTKDGFVGIRNAADGTPVHGFKIAGGAYSSPVFADDVLYVFDAYGIAAYGPVSGLVGK